MGAIPAVETTALTKRYGNVTALRGVDVTVEAGSVFGLIGPNGAGKTTMMRVLLDIIRPTSGEARVFGIDPRVGGPDLRTDVGYLPGELRLESRVRGRDLLAHLERISGPVAHGTIERLASRLGVDLSRPVRSLSKGNKQKIGLIQAFMHEPRLLVLDEPTSGLDPLVQQEFLAMVREARANGQTVFLSSHVLSEIEQAADTVAILRGGEIVAESRVEQLRRRAQRHVRVGVAEQDEAALRSTLARVKGLTVENHHAMQSGGIANVHARLDGRIDDLVAALAVHPIEDLVIDEPDLEEVVLGFYAEQEARQ